MSREVLEKMKTDELAAICKEKSIPHYRGKTRFRKGELIDAILNVQKQEVKDNRLPISVTEVVEEKIEEDVSVVVKEKETTDITQLPGTKKYLEGIQLGTLVAFKEASGKLNTAAVCNVSFKRRQLRLVTQYEKEFIVSFDDVIWVRTTKRWPKFVMDVLKQQQRRAQQNDSSDKKRHSVN